MNPEPEMTLTQKIVGAVVPALLICLGCDVEGEMEDKLPGQCRYAKATVKPVIKVGKKRTLDTAKGNAPSYQGHQRNAQLSSGAPGTLHLSGGGKAGLLMRRQNGPTPEMVLADPTTGLVEAIDALEKIHLRNAGLYYDASGAAVVLTSGTAGYTEYTRDASGTWAKAEALSAGDLMSAAGAKVSGLVPLRSEVAGGKMETFAQLYTADKNYKLLRGSRDMAAKSKWGFKTMPLPGTPDGTLSIRAGANGAAHAVFRKFKQPCDPCDVNLYVGTLAPGATTWTSEVVHAGEWGDKSDTYVEAADLVVDGDGKLFVAGHLISRGMSGSYIRTRLQLFGKAGGAWCGETITKENDGYVGSDGAGHTGATPQLARDSAGRFHILYRDQAIWHGKMGQNVMRGQLRLAVGAGNSWTHKTLISQKGQKASPKPLYGLVGPALATSADGKKVIAAGVEFTWMTDTANNFQDSPGVDYDAVILEASVN